VLKAVVGAFVGRNIMGDGCAVFWLLRSSYFFTNKTYG